MLSLQRSLEDGQLSLKRHLHKTNTLLKWTPKHYFGGFTKTDPSLRWTHSAGHSVVCLRKRVRVKYNAED